jgi:hypothetical protein
MNTNCWLCFDRDLSAYHLENMISYEVHVVNRL